MNEEREKDTHTHTHTQKKYTYRQMNKWYLLRLSKRNCCWWRLLFIVVIGKFVFVGIDPGINIMFYLYL